MSIEVRARPKNLMFKYSIIHFYGMKLLSTTEKSQGRFISLHTYIVFVISHSLPLPFHLSFYLRLVVVGIYIYFLLILVRWCNVGIVIIWAEKDVTIKVSALSIARHTQTQARTDKS